jgi:hypothetical protein
MVFGFSQVVSQHKGFRVKGGKVLKKFLKILNFAKGGWLNVSTVLW